MPAMVELIQGRMAELGNRQAVAVG
jgi:hypothetical protein